MTHILLTFVFASALINFVSGDPCQNTPTPTCSASINVKPTQPGHGAFMYNDIIVSNSGDCPITNVFVDITLPPYAEVWAYLNVSNSTGELFGISNMLNTSSIQTGGSLVLRDSRTPIVALRSVVCEPSCMNNQQTGRSLRTQTNTLEVEVQWGASENWIALRLSNTGVQTSEVLLSDSTGLVGQIMKRELWDLDTVFTFSGAKMELPLSLELTSIEGDKIFLSNFITSFSHAILDSGRTYNMSNIIKSEDETLIMVVHPESTPNWIGLTPYGPLAANVTSVSVRAQNVPNFIPMSRVPSSVSFELESPFLALELPLLVEATFSDGSVLSFENLEKLF